MLTGIAIVQFLGDNETMSRRLVVLNRVTNSIDKDHIALDLIYNWLPRKAAFVIQQFWTAVIFGLGIVMIVWGIEAVQTMGGKYWEMWYFAWEDGGIVFKPNYMPKKYAIAIVPISGFLVCVASVASIIEDSLRLMAGTYRQSNDLDTAE